MGVVQAPLPVKLILGVLSARAEIFPEAKLRLEKAWGPVDYESPLLPFNATNYYEKEMGGPLKRGFLSFKELISPEALAEIKCFTNKVEREFACAGKRQVNLDPGYLSLAKLVLASTKDYSHRVYLQKGIYAEVTLKYEKGEFKPWPWTYPDYKSKSYHEIFQEIRNLYAQALKKCPQG